MGLDEELSDPSINPATGSLESWRPGRTCWYGCISHAWILISHLCHSGTLLYPLVEQSNRTSTLGWPKASLQKRPLTSDPLVLTPMRYSFIFLEDLQNPVLVYLKTIYKNFYFISALRFEKKLISEQFCCLHEPQPGFSDISDAAVQTSLNTKGVISRVH